MKNRHTTMLCVRGSTIALFTMCRNDHGIASYKQSLRIKITTFSLTYLYDTNCKKRNIVQAYMFHIQKALHIK